MSRKLPGLLQLISFFLTSQLLQAQALYPVAFVEKVKNAPVIVEGIVENQSAFWNKNHTMIFTSNKVKLYKSFGATLSSDYIQVLTQGGTVGNRSFGASDLLQLEKGDIAMFFCFPNELKIADPFTGEQLYDVYASSQGCYKYDVVNMTAGVPFDRFSSITKGLYPAITKLTGKSFVNRQPSVSFELPPATSGAGQLSVTSFSPQVVNAGAFQQTDSNLLTITGSNFGNPTGSAAILFDDPDDGTGGAPFIVAATSSLVTSWTSTQIKVKVPARAGTGIFSVRTSGGTLYPGALPLVINYAVMTANFAGDNVLESNLVSTNSQGGYNIVYSTSTAGGGRNLSDAPERATFQRALSTWREICGANIREAGTTANQVISGDDDLNTVVLDNTNTTVPVLSAGVLAITYSYNSTCNPGGSFVYPAQKTGFDIVIRNNNVSAGNTNLTVGPCPPATNVNQTDLEMVLLHELGHALNLGHINEPFEGSQLPNINPSKLMNYSIVNGVKRTSPDYSASTGARYCIRQKGLVHGTCTGFTQEMTPLAVIVEPNDECPLAFPVNATFNNTPVAFDLVHATSNVKVDPQYTRINCTGLGTGVTNTAYYAIKTNDQPGSLNISVSNYATVPAEQMNCAGAGIEMALYRVNSCREGQNYPTPVACRTFNGNGILSNITGLEKNATYLLMVDGISNTKGNFTLTFTGPVLQTKTEDFYGNISGPDNVIYWEYDALTGVEQVKLERSTNGSSYTDISSWSIDVFDLNGSYTDKQAPANSYYRLRFLNLDGSESFSDIINLNRNNAASWNLRPNPTQGVIRIFASNVNPGRYTFRVFTSSGMMVLKQDEDINASAQYIQLAGKQLSSGIYRVIVTNSNGENSYVGNITVIH